MSIDALKAFSNTPPARFNQTPTGRTKPLTQSFDEILKATNEQGLTSKERSIKALEMVQVARMQMMQGLFELLEGAQESDAFVRPKNNASLLLPQAPSQKFDNRIINPPTSQAKLTNTLLSEREEIEKMIERVAKHVSLAPELIRSVVNTESNFKPDATSQAGAQGLMQIMPETAKELGIENSFDPLQNLHGGSRYLKQLLDKYDGDLDHALAAYNWGQGNVDRKGLANMPQETRDYLVRVKTQLANG